MIVFKSINISFTNEKEKPGCFNNPGILMFNIVDNFFSIILFLLSSGKLLLFRKYWQ